jgi:hypothetical protein
MVSVRANSHVSISNNASAGAAKAKPAGGKPVDAAVSAEFKRSINALAEAMVEFIKPDVEAAQAEAQRPLFRKFFDKATLAPVDPGVVDLLPGTTQAYWVNSKVDAHVGDQVIAYLDAKNRLTYLQTITEDMPWTYDVAKKEWSS